MKNLVIIILCVIFTLVGLVVFTEYENYQSVSYLYGYPIISFGDSAIGIIAVGGAAFGVIAVGAGGFGVISVGWVSAGILFGMAQFGLGGLFYVGQFGIGIAFCLAQFGLGVNAVADPGYRVLKPDVLKELSAELGEVLAIPKLR